MWSFRRKPSNIEYQLESISDEVREMKYTVNKIDETVNPHRHTPLCDRDDSTCNTDSKNKKESNCSCNSQSSVIDDFFKIIIVTFLIYSILYAMQRWKLL